MAMTGDSRWFTEICASNCLGLAAALVRSILTRYTSLERRHFATYRITLSATTLRERQINLKSQTPLLRFVVQCTGYNISVVVKQIHAQQIQVMQFTLETRRGHGDTVC